MAPPLPHDDENIRSNLFHLDTDRLGLVPLVVRVTHFGWISLQLALISENNLHQTASDEKSFISKCEEHLSACRFLLSSVIVRTYQTMKQHND